MAIAFGGSPKTKTPKGTKPNRKRRNEAPWKDEEQFKRFYLALVQAMISDLIFGNRINQGDRILGNDTCESRERLQS